MTVRYGRESADMKTSVLLIKHIGRDGPEIFCGLTYNNKIIIAGLLDTSANVTVISYA